MTIAELLVPGFTVFMAGVTLALISTLLLNLLYAFLQVIGRTFWD